MRALSLGRFSRAELHRLVLQRGVTDASASTITPASAQSIAYAGAWPTAQLIHLPIHASWLNQAELLFSIVQRKAPTPNNFDSLNELTHRLIAVGNHYRQIARPFESTFTRQRLQPRARPDRRPRAAPAARGLRRCRRERRARRRVSAVRR